MRFGSIATLLLTGQVALASLFFTESKSDRIRRHLEDIGYEVVDSAGHFKDSILESLDPEGLSHWLEAHGIAHSTEELVETAKQHKDDLLKDVRDYAESAHHTAEDFITKGKEFYAAHTAAVHDSIVEKWSDSRLKEFLDARGFKVPQLSKRDELLAHVARVKHQLPISFHGPTGTFWFDGWTREELSKKLHHLGESIEGSRKELAKRLHTAYVKSFGEGKAHGEESAEKVKHTFGEFKEASHETFSKWSIEDLKDYLSEFGAEIKGGKDHLVKSAREHYAYFIGGAKKKSALDHVKEHLSSVSLRVRDHLSRLLGANTFFQSDL